MPAENSTPHSAASTVSMSAIRAIVASSLPT